MRYLAALLIFPALAIAECDIELQEIKPTVRGYLTPLHDKPNASIEKEEFQLAYQELSELLQRITQCWEHYEAYEHENLRYERWGKWSNKYWSYRLELQSITLQLMAAAGAVNSDGSHARNFNSDMWEKVTLEFYEREI